MKIFKITCLFLALSMAVAAFSACSSESDKKNTDSTTTSVTTKAHLHLDPVKFPSEFDFEDSNSIVRLFDTCRELDGIKTTVLAKSKIIIMKGKINGKSFTLNINLSKSDGNTSPEQIVTCAKLFWHCYPVMYARFATDKTPTSVNLNFENEGYEVASASGNSVHIHDEWLKNNPTDYDCLTHEFSHVIQSGWDGNYVPTSGEDTYMIERFADYCRFLYAYNGGYYNDRGWELQTSETENSYVSGVRFWVWLDYTYSTKEIDIINNIQQAVNKKSYKRSDWESTGKAWDEIFKGTGALGKSLDELWEEYTASEICNLSSKSPRPGSLSPLLKHTQFRTAIHDRYPESYTYWKGEY